MDCCINSDFIANGIIDMAISDFVINNSIINVKAKYLSALL